MNFFTKVVSISVLVLISGCNSPVNQNINLISQLPAVQTNTIVKSSDTFFPVDPDFVWQYDVVFSRVDDPYHEYKGTYTVMVDSVKKQHNKTILVLKAIDTFSERYSFPVFEMTPGNITLKDVNFFGFGSVLTDDKIIDFLHLPIKKDARWDDGEWIGKVTDRETVQVPAGKFDTWKVDFIGVHDQDYSAVGDYWVTPGVGIVKSKMTLPGWYVESELILADPQGKRKLVKK